jgi:bla regulator protein blaR1
MTAHLWQSTLFAGLAAVLSLAFRKQRAGIRYWIWLAASLKFLSPD